MSAAAVVPFITAFGNDVAEGLTASPKTLPPSWLYDEVGSALFDVITLLPEYGVTRAEAALLERSSVDIVRAARNPRLIIELGSGSGSKTRHILEAAASRSPVRYLPVDISASALDVCSATLSGLRNLTIKPVENTYLPGIDRALEARRPGEPAMILFLGSTIGNFTPADMNSFLRAVRNKLQPGDTLLLGADLVKPSRKLIDAYDDPARVTAAFNLNLLTRINRELGGHFNTRTFAHEARYNERLSRVEMHLRSLVPQDVRIAALDLVVSFKAGETIWTESSHKFRAESLARAGKRAGWTCLQQWCDNDWGFAETLFTIQ
jgi:L-histidine Nalpha-methyltransferase